MQLAANLVTCGSSQSWQNLDFSKKNVSSIADLPDNTVSGTASADRDGRHLSKTWKPQETASAQTDAKSR